MSSITNSEQQALDLLRTTLASKSADEITAATARYRARVANGTLPPGQVAVTLKHLNKMGDSEVVFPRVDLSQLSELDEDALIAVAAAERIISEAQSQRNTSVIATEPGTGSAVRIDNVKDALNAPAVVITNMIVGG